VLSSSVGVSPGNPHQYRYLSIVDCSRQSFSAVNVDVLPNFD